MTCINRIKLSALFAEVSNRKIRKREDRITIAMKREKIIKIVVDVLICATSEWLSSKMYRDFQ
jgi:hypothetical protein